MAALDRPVYLYVKTHRRTGLKYFGRTVEDPHDYGGSGAYWTRHLQKFGNDVDTVIVGTFVDSDRLRSAATSFSAENDIAASTQWANLYPEDGGEAGAGFRLSDDHSPKIAALDAAVRARLGRDDLTEGPKVISSKSDDAPLQGEPSTDWGKVVGIGVCLVVAFFVFRSVTNQDTPRPAVPTDESQPAWTAAEERACKSAVDEVNRLRSTLDDASRWDADGDGQLDATTRSEYADLADRESAAHNRIYDDCGANTALWDYVRENWDMPG